MKNPKVGLCYAQPSCKILSKYIERLLWKCADEKNRQTGGQWQPNLIISSSNNYFYAHVHTVPDILKHFNKIF